MGTCVICASVLTARQARYCGERCRNRRQRAPRKQTDWRYGHRICEVCGAEYQYTYSKQRTCGRVCGAEINSRLTDQAMAAVPCVLRRLCGLLGGVHQAGSSQGLLRLLRPRSEAYVRAGLQRHAAAPVRCRVSVRRAAVYPEAQAL
jgi:hypothetical protein